MEVVLNTTGLALAGSNPAGDVFLLSGYFKTIRLIYKKTIHFKNSFDTIEIKIINYKWGYFCN